MASCSGKFSVYNKIHHWETRITAPNNRTHSIFAIVDPANDEYRNKKCANRWERGPFQNPTVMVANDTGKHYHTDLVIGNPRYNLMFKCPRLRDEDTTTHPESSISFYPVAFPKSEWPNNWIIPCCIGNYTVICNMPYRHRGDKSRIETGVIGRGTLGQFGPNPATDPIVSRWKKDQDGNIIYKKGNPLMEFVMITRKHDGVDFSTLEEAIKLGLVAWPGGMVEPGKSVGDTVKQEFLEEAKCGLEMSDNDRRVAEDEIDKLFRNGDIIYKGYCGDPRDTDNAWMESTVYHFHDDYGITDTIKLKAGDDAKHVCWVTWDPKHPLIMYANHAKWAEIAYKKEKFILNNLK
jgi:8-oxo-dGTP pyrophosphatase MutT (NUDIX family)